MHRQHGDPTLTAALEAALVRELRATYRLLNDAFFKGRLAAPTIELVVHRSNLGRWLPTTRTMELSRPLVLENPWSVVVEVIKHEMAHQYVHEILGERDETPHGPAFRGTCERLGIDARASGAPDVQPCASPPAPRERVVERIARLLALAESPNRHEAEAAMAAAQRLMLKHNLQAVAAPGTRDYGFVQIGKPSGRILEHERLVAMILGKHFFVEAIWVPVYRPLEAKRGSVLEVCGTSANIATAEYVHGFLHETGARLWRDNKRAAGIQSDRERRSYLAGVMAGFADKLARHTATCRSEGLVWVQDGDLAGYFRSRHPYVRHVRHAGQRRTDAWARGCEAGRNIVLYRPVTQGEGTQGAATSRGRLLASKP